MEHIAPLLQTILWVGLLSVILWRFHKPINGLLVALQKRIEGGSNIKAGPFEITEQLKPQDPSKQKEKAAIELQEILQNAVESESVTEPANVSKGSASLRAKYFQAEDLVLRAIQSEYGATVSRQVTAGADVGFDGAFVSNGRLNIVEVKYLSRPSANLPKVQASVDRLARAVSRYGWQNVQIILAVVVENPEEIPKVTVRLQNLVDQSSVPVPVVVRCYSFTELKKKFGIAETVDG